MIFDQGGTVSDADEADAGFLEQLIQPLLIVFIKRAGGFVQECKLGVSQEKSREGHALLFPNRKHVDPVHHAIQIAVHVVQHIRQIDLARNLCMCSSLKPRSGYG